MHLEHQKLCLISIEVPTACWVLQAFALDQQLSGGGVCLLEQTVRQKLWSWVLRYFDDTIVVIHAHCAIWTCKLSSDSGVLCWRYMTCPGASFHANNLAASMRNDMLTMSVHKCSERCSTHFRLPVYGKLFVCAVPQA